MIHVATTTRSRRLASLALGLAFALSVIGCGTTRWTDTQRTATEQLLVTDAVDRAVSGINMRGLAGHTVFLDTQYLKMSNPAMMNIDDPQYLVSTLRQHVLASGCILKEKKEDAEYIIEARNGALGTDRHDLLYGVPQTNLSGITAVPGVPAAIPEIPFAKRTVQRGVAKIAVFAYHRESGQPVWQSGVNEVASMARNTWVFGIGPFQGGTIYDRTQFGGSDIPNPLSGGSRAAEDPLWVTKEAYFERPQPPGALKTETLPAAFQGPPVPSGQPGATPQPAPNGQPAPNIQPAAAQPAVAQPVPQPNAAVNPAAPPRR